MQNNETNTMNVSLYVSISQKIVPISTGIMSTEKNTDAENTKKIFTYRYLTV